MTYQPIFRARFVWCKHKPCDGKTRLPLSNPLDIETRRINTPTETEPLTVLCPKCWKISEYLLEDFEEAVYPAGEASEGIPLYMIEVACDSPSCETRIRIYVRVYGILPKEQGIERALAALKGVLPECPDGHRLPDKPQTFFRKIQERRQSPL